MEPIYLPDKMIMGEEVDNEATFTIQPYYPGYGPTIGNALRRVLLSSLPGAAITEVKMDGVEHEFSTLEGVREDTLSFLLKLKQVRVALEGDGPQEISLELKKGKLKAGDFKTPPEVKVANTDLEILEVTSDDVSGVVRCRVERGRGYVPSEQQNDEGRDIGTIALDAMFTPVKRVSFNVENARVGQDTDYHKLLVTIKTDGTVTPEECLRQAASILKDHFEALMGDFTDSLTDERPEEVIEPEQNLIESEPENTLNQLQLPSRVHNALERVGITTVEQVSELSEEQIQDIPGLGAKAVDDILVAREEARKKKNEA